MPINVSGCAFFRQRGVNFSLFKRPIFSYVSSALGTIPLLRQERDLLVKSEKKQCLLLVCIIYADVGWVDGPEKVQKCADVI